MVHELTVGVVGCGLSSDKHLQVYRNLRNVRLVAVYDTDSDRLHEKARRYRVREVPKDYNSMLRLDLDIVDIVTPTQTHCQLAIMALESGHDVLVEKPMAVSSKECLMMISAARRSGRSICVVHNKRFYHSIRETKSAVENEGLTATRMSTLHLYAQPPQGITASWMLTEASGGILWESMVHDIYLSDYLLGKTHSVHAFANRPRQPVFDSITLVLRSEDIVAVCQLEWNAKEPVEILQLFTSGGDRFVVDLPHDFVRRRSRQYRDRRRTILRTLYDDFHDPLVKWTGHTRSLISTRSYQMALPFERTFFTLIQQYVSNVRGQSPRPPVTAEEGLRTILVLEAARRSIKASKAQSIDAD